MNTDQMKKQLRIHPVMCEVGMEMMMGFPFFEVRCNTLYVYFLLHREQKHGNLTTFFKPAYRVEFVFPFRHLCRFDNLVLEGDVEAGTPACCVEDAGFDQEYSRASAEIHRLCDLLLKETVQNGCPTPDRLTEYRRFVLSTSRTLGLSDVYRSEAE